MAEIISLNRTRKARDKASAKALSAENRLKFGRTKSEKEADKGIADALERQVDSHRRDNRQD